MGGFEGQCHRLLTCAERLLELVESSRRYDCPAGLPEANSSKDFYPNPGTDIWEILGTYQF
jgi:hypothetical protein